MCFRYESGQTDKQTYRHAHRNTSQPVLRTSNGGEVKTVFFFGQYGNFRLETGKEVRYV